MAETVEARNCAGKGAHHGTVARAWRVVKPVAKVMVALHNAEFATRLKVRPFILTFHVHETLRAAQQCADGDDQEVTERMAFGASNARVVALAEVISEVVAIGHPELLPNTLSNVQC